MAVRSRGNGTNFDWLRKSCDISTCDLSPDGNPEKYGRSKKSAIMSCFYMLTGNYPYCIYKNLNSVKFWSFYKEHFIVPRCAIT